MRVSPDSALRLAAVYARGRAVPIAQVRNGMGRGRVLGAGSAVGQCMIDGIATLDEVVCKLSISSNEHKKRSISRLDRARIGIAIN